MAEGRVIVTITLMPQQQAALRLHRQRTGETASSLIRRLVDAWLHRQITLASDREAEVVAGARR